MADINSNITSDNIIEKCSVGAIANVYFLKRLLSEQVSENVTSREAIASKNSQIGAKNFYVSSLWPLIGRNFRKLV